MEYCYEEAMKKDEVKKDAMEVTKGIRHLDGYRDRVWVSLSQKIQVAKYEPVSLNFGYATDVRDKETVADAFERAILKTKKIAKREIQAVVDKREE